MSLIVDALKKAQQLRFKESKETLLIPSSHLGRKTGQKGLWKRWTVIGIVLASLVISSIIFWRLVSSPPVSMPIRTAVRVEKKPPVHIEEKKPEEPPKALGNISKDVQGLQNKVLVSPKTKVLKTNSLSPISLSIQKGKPISIKPTAPPSSPSISLEEKSQVEPIEAKRDDGKNQPLTSEILTHFNLGVQFHNQGEFSKAIQAYQKVIELDQNYSEAYNNLGIIYQERGNLDKALGAFQKTIEINPQYEKGHNNLGILFYLKGCNEEALAAFQKAIALNPNNVETYINLGVLFKKQGQMNKAIESYQKVLELNPSHRAVHYNIALLYEQQENIELAINHYQQFIQLSSLSYSDLVLKVQMHLENLMKAKKENK